MPIPMMPCTEPGARLVALAETHAADFATRAAEHDRDASFPFENCAAMKASGFSGACVPPELGGFGVVSAHDLITAVSRLAHGDASTAIGFSMHLIATWAMARRWATSEPPRPGEELLQRTAAGELLFAAINSESGSDPRHPFTEATKADGGWRITGRKAFGTMSPAADYYSCAVMAHDNEGTKRTGSVLVHRDTPGMRIDPTWDAFGMRASGSHDIVFEDCFVADTAMTLGPPWGTLVPGAGGMLGGLLLASVFLGIAESAREHAVHAAMTRKRRRTTPMRELPAVQGAVAELDVTLGACLASMERACRLVDELVAATPPITDLAVLRELLAEIQAAKYFVNRGAIDVCDRALALSGGAGYFMSHPLSRLYRDVRAGPFMSPLTASDGLEYIGRVAVGLDPDVDPNDPNDPDVD